MPSSVISAISSARPDSSTPSSKVLALRCSISPSALRRQASCQTICGRAQVKCRTGASQVSCVERQKWAGTRRCWRSQAARSRCSRSLATDSKPPLVLLHEGLGSVGLWRGFPGTTRDRDEPTNDRVLALRPRAIRPAAEAPHADVHARGGARGSAGTARGDASGATDPRRPQRRRLDRVDLCRAPPRHGGSGDRAARVRRDDVHRRDPRDEEGLRGRRTYENG